MMLPALRILGLQSPRTTVEVRGALATEFGLDESDLTLMLPSGRQSTFSNRVAWAYSYLKQAALISSPRRGVYAITERGHDVLAENPSRVDIGYLERYPEFHAFRQLSATTNEPAVEVSPLPGVGLTPDEQVRNGSRQLRESLAAQLLERVRAVTPAGFEQLVVDVLVGLGYGGSINDAGRVVGGGGDEGIDGIIKEDRLGLDFIYVQAKRWQGTVGRPEIQRFAGALQGQRARKGIFITTSTFTADAISYAAGLQVSIVLVDGRRLAELMMDAQVGVSLAETITVLRHDEDYFESLGAS
ncbi:MAG: restriction endonuclease [Gemmatimonadales bacterium]